MDIDKVAKRGRVSAREQIEEYLNIPMPLIFEMHFKSLKTAEEIVKKFSELTKGEIKAGSATIIRTLLECVKENSNMKLEDYPFAQPEEKKERGFHFRENGFRAKLERASKKTLFEVIDEFPKLDAEGILDQINLLYGVKAEKHALFNAITSAIENKEIAEDRYERLLPTRRKRKVTITLDGEESEGPVTKRVELTISAVCTVCGTQEKWRTTTASLGNSGDMGLKGRKCKDCGKWHTHKATATIGDKKVIKQVIHHNDVDAEEFIDKDGQIIDNPLTPDDLV